MPHPRRLGLALALVLAATSSPELADAAAHVTGPDADRPALARERVLLIHDQVQRREHLVFEFTFEDASDPFALLIPVPSKPELAPLAGSPFAGLHDGLGFRPRPQLEGVGVVDPHPRARITGSTFAAADADALARWLAEHGLARPPALDAWLDRYVALGFWLVAVRVDPPQGAARAQPRITTGALRVSFATPLPYYPYAEPLAPSPSRPRLLELWYVGATPVVPVALREHDAIAGWVQPIQRGRVYRNVEGRVPAPLGPELTPLLPSGSLLVQTFQDQKRDRAGFGDVLFAFGDGVARTPELDAALTPLLGLLDPALIGASEVTP